MSLDAHPRTTEGRKPRATGQRRFWAHALLSLGAVTGACAIFLSWSVRERIAETSVLDDYRTSVSLAWSSAFQFVIVASAAVGAVVATLGLPALRGYRRGAAAYVLIGLAGLGLAFSGAMFLLVQAARETL
jgi:hypothetical protein